MRDFKYCVRKLVLRNGTVVATMLCDVLTLVVSDLEAVQEIFPEVIERSAHARSLAHPRRAHATPRTRRPRAAWHDGRRQSARALCTYTS